VYTSDGAPDINKNNNGMDGLFAIKAITARRQQALTE